MIFQDLWQKQWYFRIFDMAYDFSGFLPQTIIFQDFWHKQWFFRIFDTNNDGFIDKREFRWMTTSTVISPEVIQTVFQVSKSSMNAPNLFQIAYYHKNVLIWKQLLSCSDSDVKCFQGQKLNLIWFLFLIRDATRTRMGNLIFKSFTRWLQGCFNVLTIWFM